MVGAGSCGWVESVGGAGRMWVQLRDPQSFCGDDIITITHAGADLWSVPLPVVELLFVYHEKLKMRRHGRRKMINIQLQ